MMIIENGNATIIMRFEDLALGARFRYHVHPHGRVWIKISDEDCGLIVEYDPEGIKQARWIGQSICCVDETPELAAKTLCELMEP